MTETRKIAAILAADVVGFSRMANADEDRTLARLRALRSDLTDPTVAVHNGRVVKRTGDGLIVEFRSVVDAVRCAIEVQTSMADRNAGLPQDQRIDFRIGIHLGDVVEESDGDLMGDGVNIAARLEGIAEPGAIYLSEDAYRQVKGRLDLAVTDLGPTALKNIAEPVRVYSLHVGKPAAGRPVTPVRPPEPRRRSMLTPLGAGIAALIVVVGGARYFLGGTVTELTEQRPWMHLITPHSMIIASPLHFDDSGGHLSVIFRTKNGGHNPAKYVVVHADMFVPDHLMKTYDDFWKDCDDLRTANPPPDMRPGKTVFPEQEYPQQRWLSLSPGDIKKLEGLQDKRDRR